MSWSAPGSKLNFDGRMASAPQEIMDKWAKHFKKLYAPSEDISFDNEHNSYISRQMQIINVNLLFPGPPIISTDQVQAAVRLGKKKKKKKKSRG